MKNKKNKKKIYISIFVIIVLILTFFIGKQVGASSEITSSDTNTTIAQKTVGTQDITKTLTGSGEITSSSSEKLTLVTTKYFKTMCVEEGDEVSEGENILQYSNGTYLTAPYDCVITSYSLPETGSICTSSNYIEVQNIEELIMKLSINESEIQELKVGQEVEITLSADETKVYTGKITKIDAVGTYASSGTTFSATLKFANDGNVKIGMSASYTVTLEKAEACIAVPIEAVQTTENEKYVIVVNQDGTTKNVTIETGISNDSYVQVLSGLSGNETIQMIETTSTSSSRTNSTNRQNSSTGMPSMENGFGSVSPMQSK